MNKWPNMDTAPRDGSPIRAMIPGHGDCLISWMGGLEDSNGNECGGWRYDGPGKPPIDWTDSICWQRNEACVPSVQPVQWKPCR